GSDVVLVGLGVEVGYVPDQAAGAWARDGKTHDAPVLFGDPAAPAARVVGQGCGDQIEVRHAAAFGFDPRPVVRRDLGATGTPLERCKCHHVNGAQRAD